MKHPPGWHFVYYDGTHLWLEGTRKRNPDRRVIELIHNKTRRDVTPEMPVRGQLEILENGEIYFWPEVE